MTELMISVLALVVSCISAAFSFSLQKLDSRRSTREQLSKTISELIKLNAENTAAWFVDQKSRDHLYYQRLGTISHSATSLSRQAVYLVEQDPKLVTDVEYATIAQGLVLAGDLLLADSFWQRATNASNTDFFRIVNTRGYADFLFRQGKHEVGRRHYQKALEIFNNDIDFHKYTNAFTHQMWMVSEAVNGFNEKANDHYIEAKRIFESISHPVTEQSGLSGLEMSRQGILSPAVAMTHTLAQGETPLVIPGNM